MELKENVWKIYNFTLQLQVLFSSFPGLSFEFPSQSIDSTRVEPNHLSNIYSKYRRQSSICVIGPSSGRLLHLKPHSVIILTRMWSNNTVIIQVQIVLPFVKSPLSKSYPSPSTVVSQLLAISHTILIVFLYFPITQVFQRWPTKQYWFLEALLQTKRIKKL